MKHFFSLYFLSLFIGFNLTGYLMFAQTHIQDSTLYTVKSITTEGNTKTKDFVIINELTFESGKSYTKTQLAKETEISEGILKRTPLFHSVDIVSQFDSTNVHVRITLVERWYLWPEIHIGYADQNFSNWLKNKVYLRSNFGLGIIKYNFRGRDEKISLFAMTGYDKLIRAEYKNLRLNNKGTHRLNFYFHLTHRKETPIEIINDRQSYFKSESEFAVKELSTFGYYEYRAKPNILHSFHLGYRSREVNSEINVLNPYYLPGDLNSLNYVFLRYQFSFDTRSSRILPHKGQRIFLSVEKRGLNIFSENKNTSDLLMFSYSLHTPLNDKMSVINHFTGKSNFGGQQAYFLSNALGGNNQLSGYEYYTAHGDHYFFAQQRLSAQILDYRIRLKFIPWKQFNIVPAEIYLQIFHGFGYVVNNREYYTLHNKMVNIPLYAGGLGINFVSYYDKLLRIEYSINHLKEHGLFIHFETPF